MLSSPRAGSQGCHPRGALGRQLWGLNPSSAFCRGVHNSRQPEPSCWRLFPRLGLSLGTMPASIPAPSRLLSFTACTGEGLTWGSDLLPAASGVLRSWPCTLTWPCTLACARSRPRHGSSLSLVWAQQGDSGIPLLRSVRFWGFGVKVSPHQDIRHRHWVSGRGLGPHGHIQNGLEGSLRPVPAVSRRWLTASVHPGPASRVACNQNVAGPSALLLFGADPSLGEASPGP